MGRPRQVAELIVQGRSPRQIADELRISYGSVKQYMYTAIGAGLIRRSDALFSIPAEEREAFEQLIGETKSLNRASLQWRAWDRGQALNANHLGTYLELRDVRVSRGDMYEFLSDVEVTLHDAIKGVLLAAYGDPGWWRKGVPQSVRVECARLLEEDVEPALEPYCYTTFIHLRDILDKQWALFARCLPSKATRDKKEFLAKFHRLNNIRNRVMHPVKGGSLTEDDFQFVRDFHQAMQPAQWQRCSELTGLSPVLGAAQTRVG